MLTQYKSHSLDRHIAETWRLSPCSATTWRRCRPRCVAGRAGSRARPTPSIQNLNLIYDERPDYICVFGADHIYRMDPRQMVEQHLETRRRRDGGRHPRADRAGEPVRRDRGRARRRASARSARSRRAAVGLPDAPGRRSARRWATTCSARETLIDAVVADAADEGSRHDIGGDIVPRLVDRGDAYVYDFCDQRRPWRRPTASAATGATSGRSTPTTRRTWT